MGTSCGRSHATTRPLGVTRSYLPHGVRRGYVSPPVYASFYPTHAGPRVGVSSR